MKPTTRALIKAFETRRSVYGRDKADDRRALAGWQRESRERYGTPIIVSWIMQADHLDQLPHR